MDKLYYIPPGDEQFSELKEKAIELWNTCDNEFGYVDEKVNAIKDLMNFKDNFMYIFAMFDINNQRKITNKLSDKTKEALRIRIIDGGNIE